ncbi:hypothetical protein QBC43DRAFT_282713 [Cladorrhinum sp. PSN259]|nr:hypothetical protein QBC43DRAFT_282713 [Cladorrhinum sp. PSN259]
MKTLAIIAVLSCLLVSLTLAAPIIAPEIKTLAQESNWKRDGWREFDTDLCVLKKREAEKRGDVLGQGIDNCDM